MNSRIVSTIAFSLITLFVAALPLQAQTPSPLELNLSTIGGEFLSVNPGKLALVNAWLTAVSVNGGPPIVTGSVGPVTFTTPQFSSGTLATGGAFNAGGSFFISSDWGYCIAATFVHGTWKRLGYADGTSDYVLVAEIEGTMCYQGVTYPIHGRTVEIAGEVFGDFLGTHPAGGSSTTAGVH